MAARVVHVVELRHGIALRVDLLGERFDDRPVVLLPLGLARDAPRVPDALDGLGEGAVPGVDNEVAVLGRLGTVGCVVVVRRVVGVVSVVVPCPDFVQI